MSEAPICSSCGYQHGYYSPCHGWSYKDAGEAMPPGDGTVAAILTTDTLSAIRAIVREEIERSRERP